MNKDESNNIVYENPYTIYKTYKDVRNKKMKHAYNKDYMKVNTKNLPISTNLVVNAHKVFHKGFGC